eukprot:PhF_6_TR10560/c0_g1_i1/m.16798
MPREPLFECQVPWGGGHFLSMSKRGICKDMLNICTASHSSTTNTLTLTNPDPSCWYRPFLVQPGTTLKSKRHFHCRNCFNLVCTARGRRCRVLLVEMEKQG